MTLALLVVVAVVLVAAYGATVLARRWRMPAALLLISLGLVAAVVYPNSYQGLVQQSLEVLGTIGLILIVLEGALDLHLTRERIPLIRRAAGLAVAITLLTGTIVSICFYYLLGAAPKAAMLAGVAFGIVSSAILIPSIGSLDAADREFLTYESVVSDIIGILLFSVILEADTLEIGLIWTLVGKVVVTLMVSCVGAVLLTFLLHWMAGRHRFYLILSLLVLVYAIGKWLHLPTLLLVLFFGLLINNLDRVRAFFPAAQLPQLPTQDIEEFRVLNDESAFVVRSFFFVLLGYSIEPASLIEVQALLVGGGIIAVIYSMRWCALLLFGGLRATRFVFLAPRGLVSIILYLSIPSALAIAAVSTAVLGIVVLSTALLMVAGLLLLKGRSG